MRAWCRDGKLAHVKKLRVFRKPGAPPGVTGRYGVRQMIFVSRYDLENFLRDRWQNGTHGRKKVAIDALVNMAQLAEDVEVSAYPLKPSPKNKPRDVGLRARAALHQIATRSNHVRDVTEEVEQQLELFPVYRSEYYVSE